MPKPVCLMIMPYGTKPTRPIHRSALPTSISTRCGIAPMRRSSRRSAISRSCADQDTGSMIISHMLERLYFADLVLADMTIPNGNVYYEIGIRHAAREVGCVLLAADWSRALFDVAQMRTLRYPLPEGTITDATAKAIQYKVEGLIASMARGVSPMFESIPGYPSAVNPAAASTMKDAMSELAAFQGRIRAVHALPHSDRMAKAKELAERYLQPPVTAATALALLRLLRDSANDAADWNWIIDFIGGFPSDIADLDEVRETEALAMSNAGNRRRRSISSRSCSFSPARRRSASDCLGAVTKGCSPCPPRPLKACFSLTEP